jgi:hypothetical protein
MATPRIGRTASTVVALGLTRSPFVFVTSEFNWSSVIGHTLGPGPFRPSGDGLVSMARSTCTINGNGASMTLNMSLPTRYQVYNQAFNRSRVLSSPSIGGT